MVHNSTRRQILETLSCRMRQMGCAAAGTGAAGDAQGQALFSTGIAALDRWLPPAGRSGGMMFELVADADAAGAASLAFHIAAGALARGGALVVLDHQDQFYPPAAAALGIDLGRVIVVRPRNPADAAWAFEQALRCRGVAAACCMNQRWSDRVFRRLQLAAETGTALGLIISRRAARASPAWVDLRLLVRPRPTTGQLPARRLQLELLHVRGGISGGLLELELCDETGHVRLASPVAAAAAAGRAARA